MSSFDIDFHFFNFFRISYNGNRFKQILLRIRTTIRARAIATVEKCAREAASLGATGHGDRDYFSSGGVSFFEAISGMVFSQK